ncbi:hypothetical protein CBL_20122 [Carabus blaptoides fortunei]
MDSSGAGPSRPKKKEITIIEVSSRVLPIVQQTQTKVPNDTIPKWSDIPMNIKTFPFSETNRLLQGITGNDPTDYFRAILDDEFLDLIVNETNYNAEAVFHCEEPNGIVLKSLVYTGAFDDEIGGKGHTTKVVLELLQNYLDSGQSVYLDNFYNSFELADK